MHWNFPALMGTHALPLDFHIALIAIALRCVVLFLALGESALLRFCFVKEADCMLS